MNANMRSRSCRSMGGSPMSSSGREYEDTGEAPALRGAFSLLEIILVLAILGIQ